MTDASPKERTRPTQCSGATDQQDPEQAATPDPEAARVQIRERATTVRDREVETALRKLEASEGVSTADRAAVEALADRLVARLIAVPERSLRVAEEPDPASDGDGGSEIDPETVETALDLFG